MVFVHSDLREPHLATQYEPQKSRIVPPWQLKSRRAELSGFEGYFKFGRRQIPIFRVWGAVPQGAVCLVELRACAQWVRLPAADNKTEREHVHKFFFLRIIDLGQDKVSRDAILKSNPPWLASHDEKERYLSQRAWVQVLERFEISVTNPRACRKFTWSGAS